MGGTTVISDAMTVVHLDILLGNVDPRVQETRIDAAQVPVTDQAAAGILDRAFDDISPWK